MDLTKVKDVVLISKNEIYVIIFYSFAIGLLSLVLPIAAQGLVTIVSFGSLRQPLFILMFAVFVLLSIAALFRLLQNILTENFQQRIFAINAIKIAERLPKIRLSALEKSQGPELLNRFFDIVTIQKNLADLLLNLTSILLQSILGMILLAFYHPALLAFDVVYITLLALCIYVPLRNGMSTAYYESNAKYDVVSWLEEMVRVPLLFHFSQNGKYGIRKADEYICKYVKSRQSHYKYILQHLCSSYLIQILGSTSLLLIGGLLVLNNQMTLGQLVAAELIVTALGSSTIKIAQFMEKIYDIFAASEKVHFLLTLPTEANSKLANKDVQVTKPFESPPLIELIDPHLNNRTPIVIMPYENIVFHGKKDNGISTLIQSLLGVRECHDDSIKYNHIPLKYYSIQAFRKHVSYIKHADMFDGTILENIIMGRDNIPINKIMEMIKLFKLDDAINKLELKLESWIGGFHQPLSSVELMKVVLIRSCLANPYLMVIDGGLDLFSLEDLNIIVPYLTRIDKSWTLIVTTTRLEVVNYFKNRIDQ